MALQGLARSKLSSSKSINRPSGTCRFLGIALGWCKIGIVVEVFESGVRPTSHVREGDVAGVWGKGRPA